MSIDDVLFILIGVALSFGIQYFLMPFLPKKIQHVAAYYKKKFSKIVNFSEIEIQLVIKSETYRGVEEYEKIVNLIKTTLASKFSVTIDNTNLNVKIKVGDNDVEMILLPMHDIDEENDTMKFESLECRFIAKCRYTKFESTVRDFREAQKKIETELRTISMPEFKSHLSLICKLKSLHEITGILENTNFEIMSGELSPGKQFELSKNEITLYDNDVNDEMISLAKKMIVMYD